jgi:hypothetical protein
MRNIHPDRQGNKAFPSNVTDNEAPQETRVCALCGAAGVCSYAEVLGQRAEYWARTQDVQIVARVAAISEHEQSSARATEQTFNGRKARREFQRHSSYRLELTAAGQVVEIPILRMDSGPRVADWNRVPKPRKSRRKAVKTALESRVCSMCAKEFVPARVDACLCSDACKQRAYRLRKQAASPSIENAGAR